LPERWKGIGQDLTREKLASSSAPDHLSRSSLHKRARNTQNTYPHAGDHNARGQDYVKRESNARHVGLPATL